MALANVLADITEWGWTDIPTRRLVFRGDIPRLPRRLPRYLPFDATMAAANSSVVAHLRVLRGSTCSRAQKDSMTTLS